MNAGKIDINSMLSVPIELRLTIEKNENQEYISCFNQCIYEGDDYENPTLKPISEDFKNNYDQGNLSLLKMNASQGNNLKVMVCITVYNEPASQLKSTLDAIKQNLDTFKSKCKISNQEIAVVIIYDGILKINTDPKDLESNQMKMFDIYDLKYNIQGDNTMQRQFEIYKKHLEFSKMDINQFLDTRDTSLLKLDPLVQKKYQKIEQKYIVNNIRNQELKKQYLELTSPAYQMLQLQTQQSIDQIYKNSTLQIQLIDQIYINMHIFKNIFQISDNQEFYKQFYIEIYNFLSIDGMDWFEDSFKFQKGNDNDGEKYKDLKDSFYNMEQRDLEMNYSMQNEYISIFTSILDEFLDKMCNKIRQYIIDNQGNLGIEVKKYENDYSENIELCSYQQKQQKQLDFVKKIYIYQNEFINQEEERQNNQNVGNKLFLTDDFIHESLKDIYNIKLSQSIGLQKEKFANMYQNKQLFMLYRQLQQNFITYLEYYQDNENNYNLLLKLFQNLNLIDMQSLQSTVKKIQNWEIRLQGMGLATKLKHDIIQNQDVFNFNDIKQLYQNIIQRNNNYKNQKFINDIKNQFNLTDMDKRGWQVEAISQQIEESKKYIESKAKNAWVYQIRDEVQSQKQNEQDSPIQNCFYNDESGGEESDNELQGQQNNDRQENATQEQEINNIEQQIKQQLGKHYLNLYFCVKYVNGKKLNSHLWFFRGFCELLKPEYVILIDCGLTPDKDALYNFFLNMEIDKNIGGVCGFMGVKTEAKRDEAGQRIDGFDPDKVGSISSVLHQVFDVQDVQVFEYNFAHIIDKAFESMTGFIHVLSGAFSGYRYKAFDYYDLNGKRISILDNYLIYELDKNYKIDNIEIANMFQAEDRILCKSLFCHNKHPYTLKYVCDAHAYVDPAQNLTVLLGQRKRWINGSWFALNNVLNTYGSDIKKSKHSCFSKYFKLEFSMFYARVGQFQTYFALTFYFVAMQMQFYQTFSEIKIPQPKQFESSLGTNSLGVFSFLLFLYFMLVGAMIFYSLQYTHNHPKSYKIYYGISTALGIYMWTSFILMIYNVYDNIIMFNEDVYDPMFKKDEAEFIKYSIFIVLGGHVVPLILNPCHRFNKIKELLKTLPSFLFFMPTYIHLLIIFAFCRVDNLDWGTKDEGKSSQSLKKDILFQIKVKMEKFIFFFKWIVWNMSISFLIIFGTYLNDNIKRYIMLIFVGFLLLMICWKLFFSTLYYLKNAIFRYCSIRSFLTKQKIEEYSQKSQEIQDSVFQVLLQNFIVFYKQDQENERRQLQQLQNSENQQEFQYNYLGQISSNFILADNQQNEINPNKQQIQVPEIYQQMIKEYKTSKIQIAQNIQAQTANLQSYVSCTRNNSEVVQQVINRNIGYQGGSIINQIRGNRQILDQIQEEEKEEDDVIKNQQQIIQDIQNQNPNNNQNIIAQLTGLNQNNLNGFRPVNPNQYIRK